MPELTEQEAESAIRKMATEIGDPLGGVIRALLKMLDAERAKVRGLSVLPNGWKQPTFMSVDEGDGSLNIEWCFDAHGTAGSFSVAFVWSPDDGVMTLRASRDKQETDESVTAGHTLARFLGEAK